MYFLWHEIQIFIEKKRRRNNIYGKKLKILCKINRNVIEIYLLFDLSSKYSLWVIHISKSALLFPKEFTEDPKGNTFVYGNKPRTVDSTCSQTMNLSLSLMDVILQALNKAII